MIDDSCPANAIGSYFNFKQNPEIPGKSSKILQYSFQFGACHQFVVCDGLTPMQTWSR